MKRTLLIIAFIFAIALTASAQSNPPLTITEVDGAPSKTNATKLVFQSGTLSIVGGVITYTAPVAAGTVTTAGGTPNALPKWLTSTTLGDSLAVDTGSTFTVGDPATAELQVDHDNHKINVFSDFLVNNGPVYLSSNELKSEFQVATSRGGFGADVSAQTGIALNTAGVFSWLASSGTGNVVRTTLPTFITGLSSPAITDSGLTAGRVTFAGTGGLLNDDADMTFATDTLTVTKFGATTLTGTISGGGNQINNVIIGTSTPLAASFTTVNASTSVTIGAGSAITSSGAGGALGTNAFTSTAYAASGANSDITSLSGVTAITGGASNMTITSGTGNSRTMILRTTTSGGTATTALTLGADQSATFAGAVIANADIALQDTGKLWVSGGTGPKLTLNSSASGTSGAYTFQFNTNNSSVTSTSTSVSGILSSLQFNPAAGSASYSALTLNPTVNASGAQSGTVYGLGVAVVATNLNGATLNLIDVGTTTSTLFSGYTSKFKVDNSGNVTMAAAGKLSIASGTNQRAGNATLVGGTVTVSNTTVTANTVVLLTRKTSGGTIGTAITYTLSAGTSFTITSDNILDTSVFSYVLIEVP